MIVMSPAVPVPELVESDSADPVLVMSRPANRVMPLGEVIQAPRWIDLPAYMATLLLVKAVLKVTLPALCKIRCEAVGTLDKIARSAPDCRRTVALLVLMVP